MVAIGVDEALAVALQEAAPLQAGVEEIGVVAGAGGEPRVLDREALAREVDAGGGGGRADLVLAAEEDGGAETLAGEARGGADHLLLLALGEDHALRLLAHLGEDALQRARGGVAPGGELVAVGLPVDDGAAGDAAVDGGAGDGLRDGRDQARVEGTGMM